MRGGKQLLLLAVSVLLARCQQKPKVSMSPTLEQIFSGDLFYLSCDNSIGDTVKWYVNNEEQNTTIKTWKIAVADPNDSGSYQCESNGQKSDIFDINILDYIPSASLIIKSGLPVMPTGHELVLEIENEDGLKGWNCWVYRGETTKRLRLKLNNDSVSLTFQTKLQEVPETIFWCTDETKARRSNAITIRTSVKDVMLEMDHVPAVVGGSLTLRCYVWGTNQISHAVFYKDDAIIVNSHNPTYKISNVTKSTKGRYKCDATYTHSEHATGPPYQMVSDNQDIFVKAPPMKAVVSENNGLSCSCPLCPSGTSYHWYYKNNDGKSWARMASGHESMTPTKSGIYACQAVWTNKRSFLSNGYDFSVSDKLLVIIIVSILVVMLICALFVLYIYYKKRNTPGPIYEDVVRVKGDENYEMLEKPHGSQKESEYSTLHQEAPGKDKKEGEYQPLKKEGMKEGVYHTLGIEGAAGETGGYEALKKEGMKEGVYHTLGMEGAEGETGGYEALKKQGMKDGVYHTLGMEGAEGETGGYEALKKQGMKEGVYHTLAMEGPGRGEGGHEAAGKDKDKEYEIVEEKTQAQGEEQKTEP